jgi:hypothetical protein
MNPGWSIYDAESSTHILMAAHAERNARGGRFAAGAL